MSMELVVRDDGVVVERLAAGSFLAGSSGATCVSCGTDLRLFADWCRTRLWGVPAVNRVQLELYARWLEAQGRAPATIARRLSTLASFYRYCQLEALIDRSPALHVRRPKLDCESHTLGLDRTELGLSGRRRGVGSS
jgi:integrase/recombinase XerD